MQKQSDYDKSKPNEKPQPEPVKDLEPKSDAKGGKGNFSEIVVTKPTDTASPGHP